MRKKIRVKQRDVSDCGPACLASVAAYYGLQISVSSIRQQAGTDPQGTSLFGLIEAAERLNFQAKGARAAGMTMDGIPLPAIFHWVLENGLQHFVVVYTIRKNGIRYMDPSEGKIIRQSKADFEKRWTRVVLLLMPSEFFRTGNEKVSVLQRFWNLILPHRRMLLQALIGAAIYTLLGLSTSIYVQKIVDFVLPDGNRSLMNLMGMAMVLLLCFQILAGYFKSLIALRTGQQMDSWLILAYYKHLLELPQRFFDGMRVGEIISRVNDAMRIRVFINDIALGLVLQILTLMLSSAVMFVFYRKLALLMLATIPVYLTIYLISNRINARWQRKIMETGASLESQLVESIQGIGTIRRFGVEDCFNLKTEKRLVPFMRALYSSSRNGLRLSGITEWVTSLLSITILWSGSHLVMNGSLSPGELLSFYTLTAFFTAPVQALIGANRSMQDALIAADRLFEIMDLETESGREEQQGTEIFPEGDLVFSRVNFCFGAGGPPVFEDLELCIPRNQVTGIIGESGSGKSTLLSLLQKIHPVKDGSLLIGELDIQYISTGKLRMEIAAVPQQTDLFQGSIISNIALGETEPDMARVFDICRRLGLHEYISRLPARYQTIIREQGMNLSGGQKQKLGIARALYRNPSILVMDEATSALDPESERKVMDTIRWFYAQKKTVILIAHRLTTLRDCDSIVFLKQGKAVACGKHEILLSENQEYADWWLNML